MSWLNKIIHSDLLICSRRWTSNLQTRGQIWPTVVERVKYQISYLLRLRSGNNPLTFWLLYSEGYYERFNALKRQNPDLKTLLALGGGETKTCCVNLKTSSSMIAISYGWWWGCSSWSTPCLCHYFCPHFALKQVRRTTRVSGRWGEYLTCANYNVRQGLKAFLEKIVLDKNWNNSKLCSNNVEDSNLLFLRI
jgi:hypothetical protein